MLVTAYNRGPDPATLHLLPTLWFRNTWSWGDDVAEADDRRARRRARARCRARLTRRARRVAVLRATRSAELLFCENETNNQRLFGTPNASPYVKDGINDFVVGGVAGAVNPERTRHQGRRPPRARARAGQSARSASG